MIFDSKLYRTALSQVPRLHLILTIQSAVLYSYLTHEFIKSNQQLKIMISGLCPGLYKLCQNRALPGQPCTTVLCFQLVNLHLA